MKTKNILKTLAAALLMPALLLTTACSSEDDALNIPAENTIKKGYNLPVTLNVTRQGDDATTRATYNDETKTLVFSTGDQLFVEGNDSEAGQFAGTLTWLSEGTFSGTIYSENEYSGTAAYLLGSATTVAATLLPADYEDYGFLSVSGDGYSATLSTDATKAFATSKAAAVEQLSLESATVYSDGFALAPQNAILSITAVTGQWESAPESSSVSLQVGETTISGSVAPVEGAGDYPNALANFAVAVAGSTNPSNYTLTVDGTSVSLGSKAFVAGKIYNQKCVNINVVSPNIQENEKWLVYGTGESVRKNLVIANGATVTLSNVYLDNSYINCKGDATIIIAEGTTNTVTRSGDPAIMAGGVGTTLTITGTGSLTATSTELFGANNPAIGAVTAYEKTCGNITIESSVYLTATASGGKAITTNGGGTVTIGGKVYADGADSPFVSETIVTWDFSVLSGNAPAGYENGGVKIQECNGVISFDNCRVDTNNGDIVITNTRGKKFKSIVINYTTSSLGIQGSGWSTTAGYTATWTGNSESVSLEHSSSARGVTSIVFTLQ